MPRRILVVTAHPDPAPERLCRTLATVYATAAEHAGHEVRRLDIATLEFPLLRSNEQFEKGGVPDMLQEASQAIVWAEHLVFVFPLWLGTMPALLKGFLEQVMRPGVAFARPEGGGGFAKALLGGRSVRLIVTMGMPPLLYRLWFRDHGVAGMRRSILNFVGIKPVRETLFGLAMSNEKKRAGWIEKTRRLGEAGK